MVLAPSERLGARRVSANAHVCARQRGRVDNDVGEIHVAYAQDGAVRQVTCALHFQRCMRTPRAAPGFALAGLAVVW